MTGAGVDRLVLTVLLGAAVGAFVRSMGRRADIGRPMPTWRCWAFAAGLVAVLVALASPLHAAAEQRFSWHMVQHVLLTSVAAPLLVFSRPHLWSGAPRSWRQRWRGSPGQRAVQRIDSTVTSPPVGAAIFLGVLALWHVPGLYEAALANALVHHLEHATMIAAALVFWVGVARALRTHRVGAAVASTVVVALGMTALAALLTFARVPWYPTHVQAAAQLSIDPLEDQRVAGLVMWTPKKVVLVGVLLALIADLLRRPAREVLA